MCFMEKNALLFFAVLSSAPPIDTFKKLLTFIYKQLSIQLNTINSSQNGFKQFISSNNNLFIN